MIIKAISNFASLQFIDLRELIPSCKVTTLADDILWLQLQEKSEIWYREYQFFVNLQLQEKFS